MTHTIRKAVRANEHVMIAIAGPSGSGKTYSALRLAVGLSGGKRFVVVDSEARRATHYVPPFDFDHIDLTEPFDPDNYLDAIKTCVKADYGVIVVDSMSHEYAGVGGLTEWHDRILEERIERALKSRPNADEWQLRDVYNIPSWNEPKTAHKRMMQRFVQVRAHLIFCLRAEEKIRYVKEKDDQGREQTKIITQWAPICEKNFMYEMTASFGLDAEAPGVPRPIKLQEQHRPFFDLTRPITEQAGEQLARWATSATAPQIPSAERGPLKSDGRAQSRAESTAAPSPTAAPPAARSGPDQPTYKPEDALGMIAKMAGGSARGVDIERVFAPGCKTKQSLSLFARSSPAEYRASFDQLHREYLRWKDEH